MVLLDNLYYITAKQSDVSDFICCTIRLNPEHYIYKAHFPENPITPGVCILQIATELLEVHLDKKLELITVNNVKYLGIISPAEVVNVDYQFALASDDTQLKVKLSVKNSEKIFAKISLTYNYAD